MSDLFGNSAQPAWMAPEQRDRILGEEGRANAASFDQAFQSAYGRQQASDIQEEREKTDRERITGKAGGMMGALQGVNDTKGWLEATSKNPLYAMDPDTASAWNQMGKNFMTHDAIKLKSDIALDNIDIKQGQLDAKIAKDAQNTADMKEAVELSKQQSKFFFGNITSVEDVAEKQRASDLWASGDREGALRIVQNSEGYKAAQIKLRTAGAVSEIDEKGKQSRLNIGARHEAKLQELEKNQEYRVALQQMKVTDPTGKVVSLQEFLNRQMGRVEDIIRKNGTLTDADAIQKQAQYILTKTYDRMVADTEDRKRLQDAKTAAPTPFQQKTAAPAPAAQPVPTTPGGTNSIDFNDFQSWKGGK